jgi:hypothetical protein
MASKFGGVSVDEQKPTGSKFGGVVVDEDKPPKPSLGEEAYAGAVGLASGVLGGVGDIESMVTTPAKDPKLRGYETVFPTSENVRTGFEKLGLPKPAQGTEASLRLGELAPAIAGGAQLAKTLGTYGVTKVGDIAKNLIKKPEPIAEVKDLADVGKKGFDLLKDKAAKLFDARRIEANTKYENAFNAARQAQAKGEPFATSQQGRTLIAELQNEKRVIAGNKEFLRGEEKIAGIDRLIKAIEGKTVGGQTVPVGKGLVSGKISKKTPSTTTEKDVEAIVEELRFLRDVDAKGKPYEAYASLDAGYKRDLIKKLEDRLYQWSPEYRAADEAYKAASAKLAPFKTELMSNALKGEKFDATDLVKSPEQFGQIFFKDVNAVKNLKEATASPAEVATLGKDYVASVFANKSPQQVQQFVKDTANTGWLKEAGIYEDVVNYANKATTSQSRQEILKQLGKGAAYTAGALTLGGPVYYGVRRGLGF